jgi:hypothetical protein
MKTFRFGRDFEILTAEGPSEFRIKEPISETEILGFSYSQFDITKDEIKVINCSGSFLTDLKVSDRVLVRVFDFGGNKIEFWSKNWITLGQVDKIELVGSGSVTTVNLYQASGSL